jgi:anti-anti-sigma factor
VLQETFAVEVAHVDGIVKVRGELDLASVPLLEQAVAAFDARDVIIDCADLTFIDSSGLDAIVRMLDRRRERGGSLMLRNTSPHVRLVLKITGLLMLLERPLN